jgi:molybdopterin synthase sulfur carrier subunit
MVSLRLPSMLHPLARGHSRIEVTAATLGIALDAVREQYPALERRLRNEQGELRRYVNFYVDGEECRRLGGVDTPLSDHSEVMVIPSVAGG